MKLQLESLKLGDKLLSNCYIMVTIETLLQTLLF